MIENRKSASLPGMLNRSNLWRIIVLPMMIVVGGCEHSKPFGLPPEDEPREPFSQDPLARRITFNPLDDRDAFVFGDRIIYSVLQSIREDGDRCLAILPLMGGEIERMVCEGGELPNQDRDAWLKPTVSPDGSRLAFVIERSRADFNDRAPFSRLLAVAPSDDIADYEIVLESIYQTPNDSLANDFVGLSWVTNDRLRFIAGTTFFNTLTADTNFVTLGVHDFLVSSRRMLAVKDAEDAVMFTNTPGGGMWFVEASNPSVIKEISEFGADSRIYATLPGEEILGLDRSLDLPLVIRKFVDDPIVGFRVWAARIDPDGNPTNVWRRDSDGVIPRRAIGSPTERFILVELYPPIDSPQGQLRAAGTGGTDLWIINF